MFETPDRAAIDQGVENDIKAIRPRLAQCLAWARSAEFPVSEVGIIDLPSDHYGFRAWKV